MERNVEMAEVYGVRSEERGAGCWVLGEVEEAQGSGLRAQKENPLLGGPDSYRDGVGLRTDNTL
jgi:hypothetical protein